MQFTVYSLRPMCRSQESVPSTPLGSALVLCLALWVECVFTPLSSLCSSHSAMESHSLLSPNLQQGEGVLSSFRTTWQEFVEDLGFWRVLLLILVIALLSLGIAYYVSGVLPFVDNQPELVH